MGLPALGALEGGREGPAGHLHSVAGTTLWHARLLYGGELPRARIQAYKLRTLPSTPIR